MPVVSGDARRLVIVISRMAAPPIAAFLDWVRIHPQIKVEHRMTKTMMLVAAALAGGAAAPLAAQYDPQPYPYYGYGQNDVIGQIIDGLIGNRYNVSDRQAVRQCTLAAVNQAEIQYRHYYGANWRRPYEGYNGNIRVSAITDVRRRSNGVHVTGLLDTGLYDSRPYAGYGGDLQFRCNTDYRGQVRNVQIDRDMTYGR
jgi:hypothetical protein